MSKIAFIYPGQGAQAIGMGKTFMRRVLYPGQYLTRHLRQ